MAIANIVTDINRVSSIILTLNLWSFNFVFQKSVQLLWLVTTPHSDVKLGGVSTDRLEKAIVCMFRSQLVHLRVLELEAGKILCKIAHMTIGDGLWRIKKTNKATQNSFQQFIWNSSCGRALYVM